MYEGDVVLRLDASYKIKHEKYERFNRSFFRNIYKQASKNVKEIIETTDTDLLAYKEKSGYTEPVSNLIAFDGKRGSGKTSAMLSFCDFLRRFSDYSVGRSESVCDELLEVKDSVSFTVLDCIDATLLADSKELIGAILGKMLTVIKDKEKSNLQLDQRSDTSIRKLRTRLGEIYCSMIPQETHRDEASPWEVLEQLSRSWNQQQAFRDSVQQFNKFMVENTEARKQNYLVIPIDDVDMNLLNGYELLEAIRKYMMVPNVIVLLAADDYQLEIICRQAFSKGIEAKNDSVLAQKLALEYLEKLIPSGRRIYMPDLYREENLYANSIKILQHDEREDKSEGQTIKNTIIQNVWKYVGIILNKGDETSHWLQPHSLRKLSNYVNSMRFLPEALESAGEQGEFYRNFDWFYEDIIKRYLPDVERQHNEEERKQVYAGIEKTIKKFEDEIPSRKVEKLANGLIEYKLNSSEYKLNSYGNLLVTLYQMRERNFPEICQATSFLLSLQMRRLIYLIENGEKKQEKFKEMMEFSKGDFWGSIDEIQLQKPGNVQGKYGFMCEVPVEKLAEELDAKNLLLLVMQLDIKEGEGAICGEAKYKGSFHFGNFINCVFNYEKKIDEIVELISKSDKIATERAAKIELAGDELKGEFAEWGNKYGTLRIIPFDSAEFMFRVFDRLYGEQGIFHEFETAEEYADMYQEALAGIESILKSCDNDFKKLRERYRDTTKNVFMRDLLWEYNEIYKECPFTKYMQMSEDGRAVILKYVNLFIDSSMVNEDGMRKMESETDKALDAFESS